VKKIVSLMTPSNKKKLKNYWHHRYEYTQQKAMIQIINE